MTGLDDEGVGGLEVRGIETLALSVSATLRLSFADRLVIASKLCRLMRMPWREYQISAAVIRKS